jgi:phosphatidylcholine synthase
MEAKVSELREGLGERLPEAFAWLVHLYTALGVAASLFALIAVYDGRARDMFWLLGVAILIDGTDGILARRADVKKWTANFNGRKLDDIIDYLNYTFIPVFFAYRFNLVGEYGVWVLAFVLIASLYGFCNESAKTHDGYFTGFPSFWNATVFYMYVIKTSPEFNSLLLIFLSILVFVPFKYLYPTQAQSHRLFNIFLAFVWGFATIGIMLTFDDPHPILVALSLMYAVYYLVASFAANLPKGHLPK